MIERLKKLPQTLKILLLGLYLVFWIYLESTVHHITVLRNGVFEKNGQLFHDLAISFVMKEPGHGTLLTLAVLVVTFSLVCIYSVYLLAGLEDKAAPRAVISLSPLFILLLHPVLVSFEFESFGRRLLFLSFFLVFLYVITVILRIYRPDFRRTKEFLVSGFATIRDAVDSIKGLLLEFSTGPQLLFIFLLALMTRGYMMLSRNLWWDEMAAINWNRMPLLDTLKYIAWNDSHPPLFYLLERLSIIIFGENIFAIRIIGVLAGAFSAVLVYFLAMRLFEKQDVAYLAAVLMAFNPYTVFYSQEARMYSLLLFFSLSVHYFFIEALSTRKRHYWVLFVLFMTLSFYTHYFSLFVPLAELAFLLYLKVKRHRVREDFISFCCALLVSTVLFLPWAFMANSSPLSGNFTSYLTHWLPQTAFLSVIMLPFRFVAGPYGGDASDFFAVAVVLLSMPFMYFFRREYEDRTSLVFLYIAFWVPVLSLYSLSMLSMNLTGAALFQEKQLITALPALIILLAFFARSMKSRHGNRAATVILILFSLSGLFQYYKTGINKNWTEAGALLDKEVQENDLILVSPDLSIDELKYYISRNHEKLFAISPLIFNKWKDEDYTEEEIVEYLSKTLSGKKRLWHAVRDVGAKTGRFFKRDRIANRFIISNFKPLAVDYFSSPPPVTVTLYDLSQRPEGTVTPLPTGTSVPSGEKDETEISKERALHEVQKLNSAAGTVEVRVIIDAGGAVIYNFLSDLLGFDDTLLIALQNERLEPLSVVNSAREPAKGNFYSHSFFLPSGLEKRYTIQTARQTPLESSNFLLRLINNRFIAYYFSLAQSEPFYAFPACDSSPEDRWRREVRVKIDFIHDPFYRMFVDLIKFIFATLVVAYIIVGMTGESKS